MQIKANSSDDSFQSNTFEEPIWLVKTQENLNFDQPKSNLI
jgi:hypothetical protein